MQDSKIATTQVVTMYRRFRNRNISNDREQKSNQEYRRLTLHLYFGRLLLAGEHGITGELHKRKKKIFT